MDTDSQTRGGHAGCPFGAPNYKNDILIKIVERYLPQSLEAWNAVALQYQRESNKLTLHQGEDLWESRDDGESALTDVALEDDFGIGGDKEDEEVVAVNAADDNENESAVVRPRPQSLPAFVGHGVGVSGELPSTFVVPGV